MRKRNQLLVALGAGVASAIAMTGCAGSAESAPNDSGADTLTIGTTTEVVSYSPLNSVSITDMWVMQQMYPRLYQLNAEGELTPELAESYSVSDDASEITVQLNPDFAWSDGEPITAEDVAFTMDRIAQDKLLGGSSFIANYAASTIVSDTELRIGMKQTSYGRAEDVIRTLSVMPKHVFEGVPNIAEFSIENEPDYWVSGGALTLNEIVPGQSYDFVPNENYPLRASGNEAIEHVVFTLYPDMNTMQLALQNGDLDLAAPAIPSSALGSLSQQPNIEIQETTAALNYTKLTFNASREGLDNQEVRQILSGLIDTEAIVKTVLQGHATEVLGPVLPTHVDYQPDLTPYEIDPDDAKQQLADLGYPNLSLDLVCDQGNANHMKSAQLVRDALAEAGVTVNLTCAERATSLTNAKAGEFDLYIHKLNQQSSPGSNLDMQYNPANPSGLYYNFVQDAGLSEGFAAVAAATEEKEYIAAVKDVAEYINDQAYVLPLYVESLNNAYNTSRFTGYESNGIETTTMVNGYSLAQVLPSE